MKEALKQFIYEKVKNSTTQEKPYFFVRGSGLQELCRIYNVNLLELIDEMVNEKLLCKGLVNKKLVLYIHKPINKKRLEAIREEFERFLNR
jgi:hypothetical protein